MLLALAGVSSVAMAQQKTEVVEEFGVIQVQDKYQVITNPFWSNWFFSIGGGAEATFGDNDKAGSFGKRISPTLNFAIGKWFTPGLGVRLQYSGLQARGYTYDAGADYVKGTQVDDGYYKQRFDYMNLHGDVMFNLNALFGGYNQHRVYEIIPYVGAGFTHNYTKPHREALSVNAGIINRFRISNAIDINLELSAMGVEDKFDGEVGGDHGYDGVLSATVGLTYRFPARGFRRPMPQLISQVELAAMQAQLAEQEKREKEAYEKKIQQDRIELIRLKQGVITESDRIAEEHPEKKKMPLGKRISNFFYHNKWWLGITIVLVLLFGYLAYDQLTKVKPDFVLMVLTDNEELQKKSAELQTYLEQFVDDENGDGKVTVSIYCIPVSDDIDDMDYYTANATKLSTQMQMPEGVMLLTDAKANDYISAEDTLVNLEQLYPEDSHVREYGYYLRYTDFAQKIGYSEGRLDRDLCLSLRKPTEGYKSEAVMQEYYEYAKKVLEEIMTDLDNTEPPADKPVSETPETTEQTTEQGE